MNIIAPLFYEGYSSISQTISELSAIGAPTRELLRRNRGVDGVHC